ncbi:type 1 glutamine amidotransferase domain-containing protein [Flagellimonas lutimaris]|uniref:Type 1 glutamine amidotransferase domain-containing protein n=1 Tax=Flagellimonas lutimaris TaxID=475082 RepID=A0A3A1N4V4_9FLAO|nr:type 1 glutamine amidotransferase domain-containing protein [Allomuricauda lutimaris]RIV31652.1 type 1 glutamine amidotransferase domain-containing protein [Allomuricauda lutimaris]
MKHILFIITSTDKIGNAQHRTGYEFSEVADPYLEFINEGYTVDFSSILGGRPPATGYDSSQQNSRAFKESNGFRRLNFSHKLSDIDTEAYDAIFFPGGLGPMVDMVDNALVKDIIKKFYESDRVIGAVCHGPVALLNVILSNGKNLLEDKRINSFTKSEEKLDGHKLDDIIPFMLDEELAKQGAQFLNARPFDPFVIADGNLVTGQNPASASGVALEMIKIIKD